MHLAASIDAPMSSAVRAIWSAIGALLDRFSPEEYERYIRHCSYCQSG